MMLMGLSYQCITFMGFGLELVYDAKVSSEAAFKTRPKDGLRPRFYGGYRPGLGPWLKKCGLRLHGPIVARFRPRKKTRPNKPRPKAERALGRVFRFYGRVFKTRPQNPFFVVIH